MTFNISRMTMHILNLSDKFVHYKHQVLSLHNTVLLIHVTSNIPCSSILLISNKTLILNRKKEKLVPNIKISSEHNTKGTWFLENHRYHQWAMLLLNKLRCGAMLNIPDQNIFLHVLQRSHMPHRPYSDMCSMKWDIVLRQWATDLTLSPNTCG